MRINLRSLIRSNNNPKTITNINNQVPKPTVPTPPTQKIVPIYTPPTCNAIIYDFRTNTPKYLINLPHTIYACRIRKDLLHRSVVWQRDCMRQGTHHSKGRGEVRGSTKKIAPQKGRGRARVGSRRSPVFRGGGVAHGPKSRSHATDLQVKVRESALRSALSAKYAGNQLRLVTSIDESAISSGKTKLALQILNRFYKPTNIKGLYLTNKYRKYSSVLIVTKYKSNEMPTALLRACKNLPNVKVISAVDLNVLDVLKFDFLVVDHEARKFLEWRLNPNNL